jgi:hypothetical protein
MAEPTIPMMIEKMRLERGIGKVGSVAATAMTRQALAAGRENSHE